MTEFSKDISHYAQPTGVRIQKSLECFQLRNCKGLKVKVDSTLLVSAKQRALIGTPAERVHLLCSLCEILVQRLLGKLQSPVHCPLGSLSPRLSFGWGPAVTLW